MDEDKHGEDVEAAIAIAMAMEMDDAMRRRSSFRCYRKSESALAQVSPGKGVFEERHRFVHVV